jgi:hypothetical protein
MDILQEILIKSYLNKTIIKLDNSIKDIQEKHPTRDDLINSMNETLSEIIEIKLYLQDLIEDKRVLRHLLSDLRNSNDKNRVTIERLEKSLSEALKNVNL